MEREGQKTGGGEEGGHLKFPGLGASLAHRGSPDQLGGGRKGAGAPRVGEQGPSCLAGSAQVEVRSTGPQTGGQTLLRARLGGEFPERPLPES